MRADDMGEVVTSVRAVGAKGCAAQQCVFDGGKHAKQSKSCEGGGTGGGGNAWADSKCRMHGSRASQQHDCCQ